MRMFIRTATPAEADELARRRGYDEWVWVSTSLIGPVDKLGAIYKHQMAGDWSGVEPTPVYPVLSDRLLSLIKRWDDADHVPDEIRCESLLSEINDGFTAHMLQCTKPPVE